MSSINYRVVKRCYSVGSVIASKRLGIGWNTNICSLGCWSRSMHSSM